MGFVDGLTKVAKGSAIGIAAVTALPIFGVAGTITAAGITVGAIVGPVAVIADEVIDHRKKSKEIPLIKS